MLLIRLKELLDYIKLAIGVYKGVDNWKDN